MTSLTPLKKYKFLVFFAPFFKIIECVTELIVPFVVKSIIDDGLTDTGSNYKDVPFIVWRCVLILGLALIGFACTMVSQYICSRTATSFSRDLKKSLFRHLFSLSSEQLDQFGRNKALNLLTADAPSLQNGVFMFMRLVVRAPFLVIGSVIASFLVNIYAGFVVLGVLALCALTVFIVVASTPKQYAALQAELDRLSALGEDGITGARVVRAFNKQDESQTEFEEHSETYRKRALVISKINGFLNPLTFALVNLGIVLILYLGSFHYSSTLISAGAIVALVSYLTQCLTALLQFTRLVTSLSKGWASKKRMDVFLAINPNLVGGEKTSISKKEGTPVFELRHASLSFGGESNALEDINLVVPEGSRIGIIGGTGSGKSTLLNLLIRLYDPSEGQALFYGEDMKGFDLGFLRHFSAFVSQKPSLFAGTIRSNLLFGREDASEEEIKQALIDAQAYDFVSRYDDYLEHPVEEGGLNFSGGQKQRLLIARALLSHRPVLILDDSTSALDYKTDLLVREAIKKRTGLTTIIVSQRATSIADCDNIFVLDKGRLVASGTHDELLSSCGIYAEIYSMQVNGK